MDIPIKYVIEMFIDRMSASMNYEKDKYNDRISLEYYEDRKRNIMCYTKIRGKLWNCY